MALRISIPAVVGGAATLATLSWIGTAEIIYFNGPNPTFWTAAYTTVLLLSLLLPFIWSNDYFRGFRNMAAFYVGSELLITYTPVSGLHRVTELSHLVILSVLLTVFAGGLLYYSKSLKETVKHRQELEQQL